jgi:photosystem II stability/assembly factor-like uncharacterized protein
MRPVLLALGLSALLAAPVRGDLRHFDDAALYAVHFVDAQEGWTVGDEGVVWHTIDGGRNWERQPTGVRASLRSVYFLNPYTGWIAGREELAHGAGSVGVLLFTQDGGLKWQRVGRNVFPGLNCVRFIDNKMGFAAGDGSESFPTGLFATTDSGRTWKPVPGPRCPGWLAADYADGKTGALAGPWSRLAILRDGTVGAADMDTFGGRSLGGLQLMGSRAIAVGQGGVVLTSDTGGARWTFADLGLPAPVQAAWDFHALHARGDQVWVVGRPGSKVLHSADKGQKWEVLHTGQPLPLNGVYFSDERHGWAVGEFGSVLATLDGGRTWKVQRRGGQRAAVLFVNARPAGLPLETVAWLGGQEGYLAATLRVHGSDPDSAAYARADEAIRFKAAVRRAAGAAGEMLWQFPIPQHLARADKQDLLKAWDRLHGDRTAEELLRQLVLTLRIWRPNVVITDHPDAQATGYPVDALLAEAIHEAFFQAANAKVFPEQLASLGLEPWQAGKLYGHWDSRSTAHVVMDGNDPCARLGATARDFVAPAAGLLADVPPLLPQERYYRLLDSKVEGASSHRDLMEGVALTPKGVARRDIPDLAAPNADMLRTIRVRRNLQALAETAAPELSDPARLLARVGPTLESLPSDQGAAAAFAVAGQYSRLGQWENAREVYLLLVDRYPADPLATDACRWLIRYNTSSEARRRHELGQFVLATQADFRQTQETTRTMPLGAIQSASATVRSGVEGSGEHSLAILSRHGDTRQWYQSSLDLGGRLASQGALFAADPAIQFCLQSARRNLGDFETARHWYTQFRNDHPAGPWRDAAAAELWLANRTGPPPKPVLPCRRLAARPFLDGKLDDACWQDVKPLVLRNVVGETAKECTTEVWLGYDKEYLYLALRCKHPANQYVAPVKVRPHDADLRPYDRVSLLLDLDRDYSTYYHLQIDQRGCVCDDCWGDLTWNPRWYVAVDSDAAGWRIEAAIPLIELTAEPISGGKAWACNVVRVLPGRGVQAWSTPADVQPRPEGMGLLLFGQEQAPRNPAAETGSPKTPARP